MIITYFWSNPIQFFLTLSLLYPFFKTLKWYTTVVLPENERRDDLVQISDTFMDLFAPTDTSFQVCLFDFTCVFFYVLGLFFFDLVEPPLMLLGFTLLMIQRSIMLSVCPFRMNSAGYPLHDPLVDNIFNFRVPLENDLFFSGHISVLFFMGCSIAHFSWIFYVSCIFIGIFMLYSKVHYTIDLIVAPYVSFATFCFSKWLLSFFY
jgi:hypothetical protein